MPLALMTEQSYHTQNLQIAAAAKTDVGYIAGFDSLALADVPADSHSLGHFCWSWSGD